MIITVIFTKYILQKKYYRKFTSLTDLVAYIIANN